MADLIESALGGDTVAEAEIHRLLRAFARTLCGGKPPGGGADVDWEDVAQDAARRLLTAGADCYRPQGSVESYLYVIVKTTVIQLARGADRRRRREAEWTRERTESGSSPDAPVTARWLLSRLSEDCRALVEQVFLDGASYSELARAEGLAESSVRSRLSRCLRKARELAAEGDGR